MFCCKNFQQLFNYPQVPGGLEGLISNLRTIWSCVDFFGRGNLGSGEEFGSK